MHNTAAAAFIRDTSGGKPLDESKIDQTIVNTYEQLSDEELEALQPSERLASKRLRAFGSRDLL